MPFTRHPDASRRSKCNMHIIHTNPPLPGFTRFSFPSRFYAGDAKDGRGGFTWRVVCTHFAQYRERKAKFSDIRLLIPSSFCRLFHPVIVAWNSLHRATELLLQARSTPPPTCSFCASCDVASFPKCLKVFLPVGIYYCARLRLTQ